MLRDYARLQLELVARAEAMVDLGVPDARLDRLPGLVGDLLADDASLLLGQPDGLTAEVRDRVVADQGRYAEACARLADFGVPADAAARRPARRERLRRRRAAPLLRLGRRRRLPPLHQPAGHAPGGAADAGRAERGRRPAAAPRRLPRRLARPTASLPELREQADLALTVGPLQRALTWRRILRGVHPAERAEWQDSVPGWTAEYLEPGTLTAPAARPGRTLSAWRRPTTRPATSRSPAPSSSPPAP